MPGKNFTLRSWFVVLTIFLLFMGWAADHFYFQRDARVLMLTKQLQREIDNANAAQTREEYEDAVRAGVYTIWKISEYREKSAIAMPAYAAAMRLPRKYDIDYSLRAEAEVGLAAIGKDAIPFIIGLMSEEDPEVRKSAKHAASFMISQERTHVRILSLPPEDAKKFEQRINDRGRCSGRSANWVRPSTIIMAHYPNGKMRFAHRGTEAQRRTDEESAKS